LLSGVIEHNGFNPTENWQLQAEVLGSDSVEWFTLTLAYCGNS